MNKNIKIGVIVIILLATGIIAWKNLRGGSALPSDANFICVVTGETYSIDRESINRIPVKNPDTGEATLLPLKLDSEDGTLRVDSHYRGYLDQLREVNQYVDPNTLEVRKPAQ